METNRYVVSPAWNFTSIPEGSERPFWPAGLMGVIFSVPEFSLVAGVFAMGRSASCWATVDCWMSGGLSVGFSAGLATAGAATSATLGAGGGVRTLDPGAPD